MNTFLKTFLFLTSLRAVSTALNCTLCHGDGEKCTSHGQSKMCPPGDGLCGRATFLHNGMQKVSQQCVLRKFCVGSIDCLTDNFELGKRYKNATDCVLSCCDGDNCDPPVPLQCYKCHGKGKTCKTDSVSCGYKEDRCLRINYKVDGELMTDQRCYNSSQCSKTSTICGLVKKNNTTVQECKHTCCDKPNCNAVERDDNSQPNSIPCSFLVGLLLVCALKM